MEKLIIAGKEFNSRLFLGTGKFGSLNTMKKAIIASSSQLVTMALKRVKLNDAEDEFLKNLKIENVNLLPNTSGVRNAKEAIFAANLAREALNTNWIKLEIHPDPKYLLPDPIETLIAAEELAKQGFVVLPYINADPVLCKKLEDVGASAVMPLGSPIGSNNGIRNEEMIRIIIEQSNVPVVIDAGLGAPSHAAFAMELGADAVLINTAIAIADNPVDMAEAFKLAVIAGRTAFVAKLGTTSKYSKATSPLTQFLEGNSN